MLPLSECLQVCAEVYARRVATIEREDDLPDEAYHRRETFAHYGAAMFYAQVLEQGLLNALTFAQTATHESGTQELFDMNFFANNSVTMGRMLHRFKPFLGIDLSLIEALTGALDLRNHFAHRFWVIHDKDFFSFAGREEMTAECRRAQETFQEVDARLTPVLERYLRSMGITPEQQEATRLEHFQNLHQQATQRDDAEASHGGAIQ